MKTVLSGMLRTFTRKKEIETTSDSSMVKTLSTLDLTGMGIGATLGVGVYVLAGDAAKTLAGPAVIISFAIAAIASMFAGLCYAEFGARVPKAGSAYIYSYVTMGELVAFIIGWTVILEYVIGAASVVRALSGYVDKVTSKTMSHAFQSAVPLHGETLSPYLDFFAFGTTFAFSLALAFGAKESSLANNIFTLVNLSVVLFVIFAGSAFATVSNWNLPPPPSNYGSGGFMPYGIMGIFKGAARCFYGFIGFDCVATAGEEVKDPKKSIPIAVVASLTVVFLAYFGISVVLTMVLPYYDQNDETPLPVMFQFIKWEWAVWVVNLGAICALCASLLGSLYPLPRVIYAMASDGLIFKSMGNINSRFHTPMVSTLVSGCLTGILAAIFDLVKLMDLLSIGVLLAYSIVAACVLILRYAESEGFGKREDRDPRTVKFILKQLINANHSIHSTKLTSQLVAVLVAIYFLLCIVFSVVGNQFWDEIQDGNTIVVTIMVILGILLVLTLIFIYFQPTSEAQLSFSVPFVPFIPGISILTNISLMMILTPETWIQFSVWMAIGIAIYTFYGMRHSKLRENNIPKVLLN